MPSSVSCSKPIYTVKWNDKNRMCCYNCHLLLKPDSEPRLQHAAACQAVAVVNLPMCFFPSSFGELENPQSRRSPGSALQVPSRQFDRDLHGSCPSAGTATDPGPGQGLPVTCRGRRLGTSGTSPGTGTVTARYAVTVTDPGHSRDGPAGGPGLFK